MPGHEIIHTADGSQTLIDPYTGDSYHSVNGAATESRHIFIDNGLATIPKRFVKVLEMGFGTGLNALLTYEYAIAKGVRVDYTTVEKYPLEELVWSRMGYADNPIFRDIHTALWGTATELSPLFGFRKVEADFEVTDFDTIFDIVYYDAFAPDTQPELWTTEVFRKVADSLAVDGILVTYSAKGSVKENLRRAGFNVKRLPGPPGKRHMLRAVRMKI